MGNAKAVAQTFYQRFGEGDLDAAVECFADECITVTPAGALDNEQHKAFGQVFRDAFPDARMELVRAVEAGDEVYITGRFKGTHKGDLVSPQGTMPASGNELDMPFADYFRVVDGKIVEHEVIWDQAAMAAQLAPTG